MRTIAVLGAKGRISHAVAKAFHAAGFRVLAVTRGGFVGGLPAGIEHRRADALDRRQLIEATRGADIIFNGLSPLYTDWQDKVMPMARNVVAAAEATGALHLFPGTVYNYGKEIPPVVDEKTPFHPSTAKAELRIEMERLFEQAARARGIRTIVLRAGDFYGTSRTGSWFDLVVAAKLARGTLTYPGPLDIAHAWAYVPDFARAFVALAEKAGELEPFETFNFAGHTMTGTDLIAHVEAALGHRVKCASMPWTVIRAAGLFKPMWREVAVMSYLWSVPHSLSGKKFDAIVGSFRQTSAREAVRQALLDLGIGAAAETELRAA